jgi:hypothetical protein
MASMCAPSTMVAGLVWLTLLTLLTLLALVLGALDGVDVCAEPVEAVGPDLAVLGDPVDGVVEGRRLQPARPVLGVATSADEPGALEHLEVPGDGLQAHVERLGQLVHGRLAVLGQPDEDRPAGRVGQRGEGEAERVGGHVGYIQLIR